MTIKIINIGSGELTGDGESLRSAFNKANQNFEELFSLTNFNSVTSNIVPAENELYDLGSPTNKWKSLYISSSTIYFNSTPLTVQNNIIIVGTGSEQVSYATENYVDQKISEIIEQDTVFSASAASIIDLTDITHWNTAFTWGDHSTVGYLTTVTEVDPTFSTSTAASITATDVTNWNTAYNWGDHRTANYTSLTNVISFQNVEYNTYLSGGYDFSIKDDIILVSTYPVTPIADQKCSIYSYQDFTLLREISNPDVTKSFGYIVTLHNNYAYIISGDDNICVFDTSTGNLIDTIILPYSPNTSGGAGPIEVNDDYIFVGRATKSYRGSPLGTLWNSDLGDGSGWNDLTNVKDRNYSPFVEANDYAVGDNVIGSLFIMYDTINNKYYKIEFTSWTQGGNGGGFSYTRQQIDSISGENIGSLVTFTKTDYGSEIDVIDTNISITRGESQSIYNPELEISYIDTYEEEGVVYIYDTITRNFLYELRSPGFYDQTLGGYRYNFGINLVLHNNYLFVGSDDGNDDVSGVLYIYNINSLTATNKIVTSIPIYTLLNPNYYIDNSGYDSFSTSRMVVDNNYIAVSATSETDDQNVYLSGVVYVYDMDQFTTSTITSSTYTILNPNISDTGQYDQFGLSLAIKNNMLVVGTNDGTTLFHVYDISKFNNTVIDTPLLTESNRLDSNNVVTIKAVLYEDKLLINEFIQGGPFQLNIYDINSFQSSKIASSTSINTTDIVFNTPIGNDVKFSMVNPPLTSIGTSTDVVGSFAADEFYFYYCVSPYNGSSNIWKRITWINGDTWPGGGLA